MMDSLSNYKLAALRVARRALCLGLLCVCVCHAPMAHADDYADVLSQSLETHPVQAEPIKVSGIDLPSDYYVSSLSITASFGSDVSFDFRLDPRQSAKGSYPTDSLSRYIGKPVTVSVDIEGTKKQEYRGTIALIDYSPNSGMYSISVQGDLSQLSVFAKDKLYVNQTRIESLKDTIESAGIDTKFLLNENYQKIEFQTRFGETYLNFANRIMEENGLNYIIRHIDGKTVYIFADDLANFAPYTKTVNFKDLKQNPQNPEDLDFDVTVETSQKLPRYELTDYDWSARKLVHGASGNATGLAGISDFQIGDYPFDSLQRLAEIKLHQQNVHTGKLHIRSSNAGLDLGDKVKVSDGLDYYVVDIGQGIECDAGANCHVLSNYNLVPSSLKYVPVLKTGLLTVTSVLVGIVSDSNKDAKGRIGIRFPWMAYQSEDIMYRAPLTKTAQQHEYVKGDHVLVTFIQGFYDRPIVSDKL